VTIDTTNLETPVQFARRCGCTTQRIYQLLGLGMPCEEVAGRKLVRVAEALRWRKARGHELPATKEAAFN